MKFRDFIINNNLKFQQYQEEGYEWCVEREENKLDFQSKKAGIIADEMGTGKTILIISLLVCNPYLKNLIIVPLPLLNQWVHAIKRYTQYEPFVYYGNNRKHWAKLYTNSIVMDTHHILKSGGIYISPIDNYNLSGKLYLFNMAYPIAFIIEKAGGMTSNGKTSILDLPYSSIKKTPIIFGSKEEMNILNDILNPALLFFD